MQRFKASDDAVFRYDNRVMNLAKTFIDKMSANYGGTELYRPLENSMEICKNLIDKNKAKHGRIFVLTDGQISDRQRVIELVKKCKNNVHVSTFGIGSGFDIELVKGLATAGHGDCSMVKDL